jgi:hypothetical protein
MCGPPMPTELETGAGSNADENVLGLYGLETRPRRETPFCILNCPGPDLKGFGSVPMRHFAYFARM